MKRELPDRIDDIVIAPSIHPSGPQPDGSYIMRDNDDEIDEYYRRVGDFIEAAKVAEQNDGLPSEKP